MGVQVEKLRFNENKSNYNMANPLMHKNKVFQRINLSAIVRGSASGGVVLLLISVHNLL